MIYKIINGKLTKFVAKNGEKFNKNSQKNRERNTLRNKRSHRFYDFYNNYKWHSLSLRYRQNHPICEACLREYRNGKRPLSKVHLVNSVDHIKPLKTKDGYRHRYDPKNLQSLCHEHHLEKDKRGL